MDETQYKRLREPFPREAIGRLPKGGVMLDYVGHAAVTDRLNQVDPEWTWEPMGTDDHGLPMMDAGGNLWIRLTVCGRTIPAVGDGKNAKECIGDALRNGAMRFGVGLDLWAKEDLSAMHREEKAVTRATPPPNDPGDLTNPEGDAENVIAELRKTTTLEPAQRIETIAMIKTHPSWASVRQAPVPMKDGTTMTVERLADQLVSTALATHIETTGAPA